MGGCHTIPAVCRAFHFSFTIAASGGTLALGAGLQESFAVYRISRSLAIYTGDVTFTGTRRAFFSSHKSPPI